MISTISKVNVETIEQLKEEIKNVAEYDVNETTIMINEKIGNEISKNPDVTILGRFMYRSGDNWVAIDNTDGNGYTEKGYAFNDVEEWLHDVIDDEVLYERSKHKREFVKLREQHIQKRREQALEGAMPRYFDKFKNKVDGEIIAISDWEFCNEDLEDLEDGEKFESNIYWDDCLKYLKLCGLENINESALREDEDLDMSILFKTEKNSNHALLSVYLDFDFLDDETKQKIRNKGKQLPTIERTFLLEKHIRVNNVTTYKITEVAFA